MPENRVAEFLASVAETTKGSPERFRLLESLDEDVSLVRGVVDYVYKHGGSSSCLDLKMLFSDDLLGKVQFKNPEAVRIIITGLKLKDIIANQGAEPDFRRKALDVLVALGEADPLIMTGVIMTDDTIMLLFRCLEDEELRKDAWKNLLVVLDDEEVVLPDEAFELFVEFCRTRDIEDRLVDREQIERIERFLLNLAPVKQTSSQIYKLISVIFALYSDASGLITLAVKKLEEFGLSKREDAVRAIRLIRHTLSQFDVSTIDTQFDQRALCTAILDVYTNIVNEFQLAEEAHLEDLQEFLECNSNRVKVAAQKTRSSIRSALRKWVTIVYVPPHRTNTKDEDILDDLIRHLHNPISRIPGCEIWREQDIQPGEVVKESKKRAIEKAKLIIVMLTIDLINDKEVRTSLLEPICSFVDDGDKIVLSSLRVRPCDYKHLNMPCLVEVEPDTPIVDYDVNKREGFIQKYVSRLFSAAFPDDSVYPIPGMDSDSETIVAPLPVQNTDRSADIQDKLTNQAKHDAERARDTHTPHKRPNP